MHHGTTISFSDMHFPGFFCLYFFNPLSPNSDQHQISPNNVHRLSSAASMRINQMITKIICRYSGLKG